MSIKGVFRKLFNLFLLIILSTGLFGQNEEDLPSIDSLYTEVNAVDSTHRDSVIQTAKSESVLDFEVEYDAVDSIVFNLKNNEVNLHGNAVVKYGDITLTSNQITYSFDTYTVVAVGGLDSLGKAFETPTFKQGKENFEAKKITYNFQSGKGYIQEVRTEVADAYVHAKISKKQANNQIHIKGGYFTTCDKPNPHFGFKTTKMIVIPNDKVVTGPGYLVFFNKIPIPLILPFALIPDQNKKSSGIIIPSYGNAQSTKQGFFLRDGGYYWAANDYFHTKLLGTIYANGSWGVKSESRYTVKYKFNGSLRLNYDDFIIGDRDVNTDGNGARHSKSFNVLWSHRQDAKASQFSSFNASVNYVSGNGYRDDVNSNDEEYINQNVNSNISYKLTIPNSPFNLSINTKLSQSIDASDPENVSTTNDLTLPQLTFNMQRIDLPLSFLRKNKAGSKKWYEKIGLNYTMNAENRIKFNQQQLDSINLDKNNFEQYLNIRNGVKHNASINTSFKLKTLSISPSIRTSGNWYFRHKEKYLDPIDFIEVTDTIKEFSQVWSLSGGVNFTGKVFGMYAFKGVDNWIKAMRHQVTATVGVNYSPGTSSQEFGYVGDDGDFVKYNPYDGSIYSAPNSNPSNTYNFKLINDLEAKVKTKTDSTEEYRKVKFIDNLALTASYDAMRDSLGWSDIRMNGRFTKLFDVLNINYNAVFDPYAYNDDLKKINKSWLSETGNLFRVKSAGISANFSLKSKRKEKKIKPKNEAEQAIKDEFDENPGMFENLNIPWNLIVNYNINVSNSLKLNDDGVIKNDSKLNNNLGLRGSFTIFKIFRISANTGYDFVNLEWVPSTLGLYVDLHCWELTATVRPNGRRQSYSFSLNVKSPLLKDLKIKKESTFGGGSGFF